MVKLQETKVEVKPVGWAGEYPIKYQGFVTVKRPNGDIKTISGFPRSTQKGAMDSLRDELQQRLNDINNAIVASKSHFVA